MFLCYKLRITKLDVYIFSQFTDNCLEFMKDKLNMSSVLWQPFTSSIGLLIIFASSVTHVEMSAVVMMLHVGEKPVIYISKAATKYQAL